MKTKVPLSLSDKVHLQDEGHLKQQLILSCGKFLVVDERYGELYMYSDAGLWVRVFVVINVTVEWSEN